MATVGPLWQNLLRVQILAESVHSGGLGQVHVHCSFISKKHVSVLAKKQPHLKAVEYVKRLAGLVIDDFNNGDRCLIEDFQAKKVRCLLAG